MGVKITKNKTVISREAELMSNDHIDSRKRNVNSIVIAGFHFRFLSRH